MRLQLPLSSLTSFLLLSTHVLAIAEPNPDPQAVAAGGGVAASSAAVSQVAATTYAGSLYTSLGTTSAVWVDMTVTFATTALGTWALGATPGVGSIGLGTIEGTVGAVKAAKRAEPTGEAKRCVMGKLGLEC